jgi:hypothetical protein
MRERSIHYRRRWSYVALTALLLLSAAALVLWERPRRLDLAAFQLTVNVKGAPEGTRVQAWAGPWESWPGPAWDGRDAYADTRLQGAGSAALPVVHLHIARRRWVAATIPRLTWDLVMLRLTPPSGPARYACCPCDEDIRSGLLRPRLKLTVVMDVSWDNLRVDGKAPLRVP